MSFTVSLKDTTQLGRQVIGGKAWGLSRLLCSGIPVPDGFCVTAAAFESFVRHEPVRRVLDATEEALATDSDAIRRATAVRIQAELSAIPVPPSLASQITVAYEDLSRRNGSAASVVAVRSSSLAEDDVTASFAGQHHSFLYVSGSADLLDKLRACWISLWTPEAVEYRRRRTREEHPKMAVVVQLMVEPTVSGVLFTQNPVTWRSDEVVINATGGSADTVVSGYVTPVELRFRKRSWLDWILGPRVLFASSSEDLTLLSRRQIRNLLRVARRTEELLGGPQDIEWAFAGDRLYVLQARPITGAFGNQESLPRGSWTRRGFAEWLQRPLSPIFVTLVLPALMSNLNAFVHERWGIRQPTPSWAVFRSFFYSRAGVVLTWDLLLFPYKFIRSFRTMASDWVGTFLPPYSRRVESLADVKMKELRPAALRVLLDEIISTASLCWSWVIVTGINAKIAAVLCKTVLGVLRVQRKEVDSLLSGFGSKSSEADQELWSLAERGRSDEQVMAAVTGGALPNLICQDSERVSPLSAWSADFRKWLASYGHRVFDLDVAAPTLQDRPEVAFEIIRQYLARPTEPPSARLEQTRMRRLQSGAILTVHLARYPRFARALAHWVLRVTVEYTVLREDRPFYLHRTWALLRRVLIELGERLAHFGILEVPDDVFFLNGDELHQAITWLEKSMVPQRSEFRERCQLRRALQADRARFSPPPELGFGVLQRVLWRIIRGRDRTVTGLADVLRGAPSSAGLVRGRARVVRSLHEFRSLNIGEILVVPYTTPAWTPLMPLVAALVTEVGGSLSHAAIIAREYGIPAVVGVAGLLGRVKDGMVLEVNGWAGTVRIVDDGAQEVKPGVVKT